MSEAAFNIVLHCPEIPQNTGNIARTCAATGSALHLIQPLGFSIEDRYLKRAGLDYWDKLSVTLYDSFADFENRNPGEYFLLSTKGQTSCYDARYPRGGYLIFGRETAGLPEELREKYASRLVRIPMKPGLRSLNLSNSCAVVLYEALRQNGFAGLT